MCPTAEVYWSPVASSSIRSKPHGHTTRAIKDSANRRNAMPELETDVAPENDSIFPPHVLEARRAAYRDQRLGPFKPRTSREASILTRIRGATAEPEWLPETGQPDLDALREKQRKHVDQMLDQMRQVRDLDAKLRQEEDDYTASIEAALAGDSDATEITLTTPEQRDAALTPILDRYWGAGALLVDVCDEYIEKLRELLPEVLHDLGREDREADEASRELLAQAQAKRANVFNLQQRARWYKKTAQDSQGRALHPKPGPAPRSGFVHDPKLYEIQFFDAERMSSTPKPIAKERRDADQIEVLPIEQ